MSVTLEQIAKEAGVTAMTVSNILNGRAKGKRRDALERASKVREIAQRLGYRPNASARAMARRCFDRIGLVLPEHEVGRIWSSLPAAVLKQAEACGWSVSMAQLSDRALNEAQPLPKMLEELSVDGLVACYQDTIPDGALQAIDAMDVPVIWINNKLPADCVYPDDRGAARMATQRLIELGHTDIAYIAIYTFDHDHFSRHDRRLGYEDAMKAAGLNPRLEIHPRSYTDDRRAETIEAVLSVPNRPTAFVCYEAYVAEPLIAHAWRLGLNVPVDVSVVSLGVETGGTLGLRIAGARFVPADAAAAAIDLVHAKIKDPSLNSPPCVLSPGWQVGNTIGVIRDQYSAAEA